MQQLQSGLKSFRIKFHGIFIILVLQELLGNLHNYCRFDSSKVEDLSCPQGLIVSSLFLATLMLQCMKKNSSVPYKIFDHLMA